MFSKRTIFAVVVIAIAFYYSKLKKQRNVDQEILEQSVIDSWNSQISKPKTTFQRIAVGINCNMDLIVPGVTLMKALKREPGKLLDSVTIDSLDDFTNTFTHHFTKGAAAERTFTSPEDFKTVVTTAETIPNKEHFVGGNAALMAVKISHLFKDAKIQLVGPIGPDVLNLLPSSIEVPSSSVIKTDEVHLIMEYAKNEQWGSITTPVATRFITSYDESNAKLTMLDTFFNTVSSFSPDLVLFSGLHLMEREEHGFMLQKLSEVRQGFDKIQPTVPVHLELASMANPRCVKDIINQVLIGVDSLGLNEQELSFSSHAAGGPHQDDYLTRKDQPEIHKMSDMVLWLLQTYGYSKNNPKSRLTRVHFHSLTYHIVGVVPGAWSNSESAVAAGTRLAGRQACDVGNLSPEEVDLRIPENFKLFSGDIDRQFDQENPVLSWDREGLHFVFSPVLVCHEPKKTVGLGDAISATGLMYSQFNKNFRS